MAYSNFKLDELVKIFNLTIQENSELFDTIPELECSEHLITTLQETVDLAVAINTEKARSEMIVVPVLLELRRQLKHQISLFSGVDFTVDFSQGLNGICDFIISKNPEQLFIRQPIVTIVEAKNENLNSGFGQCIAEMIAAQIFNQREGNELPAIYGVVTTGTIWRFLKLVGKTVEIDLSEYYIKDINKILGILYHAIINKEPGE
ncbi:MAG: hypothetical protein EWV55_09675 [Microcystis viridis Mv_BB_P_19951000_S69]|jgi:hypothetical protein|uniref:Uncharacterized protein n=1 Tax=Microcystis viridis Mv_BB_P_19951000_S68D TaxID=2486270 RepID=A0A552H4F8_MICVR|nr:MAG: hypothetical protein EWV77_25125 [Microcystis viridis Mv_BB_P_19951000_S68D]TRU75076.1 MAG: hypothetical protein EWV55_09675 [Microcystis viridis Mv_BB_P_19951000_S69]TRU78990.1 MAG: hypothetical protein EWV47_00785 [Microcystis viridis Mv_BB_P_19951000_S68]TRU81965.1 MAG: hypothetical protein EWV46_19695 [Microcystis viridis Mv_BB_P_19951000_S69D]